jgi:hypothetical protein
MPAPTHYTYPYRQYDQRRRSNYHRYQIPLIQPKYAKFANKQKMFQLLSNEISGFIGELTDW